MKANRLVRIALLACLLIGFEFSLLGQLPNPTAEKSAGSPRSSTWTFFANVVAIFSVNLMLSGDNGVLIAMAVTTLPGRQKRRAIAIGAGMAVIFQVAATLLAIKLLHIRFIQLVGGVLIFWISVNLFRRRRGKEAVKAGSFWRVVWFVVIADLTMSTDNILAIAAIAKGNIVLLSLGLGLSIVVVVFASGFLSLFIEKYPLIIFAGAAILGNVAGNMIMTDAFTVDIFKPSAAVRYGVQMAGAIGVVAAGYLIQRRRPAPAVVS